MKKYILFCSTCLVLFVFMGFVAKLHAQETSDGVNLTITPTVVDLINTPGAKVQGKFRIRNNLGQPISLSLHVDKLVSDNQTGQVVPQKPTPSDTYLSWITFDKSSFSASPKDWTTISFTITVPKDAAFGYYYAIRISQTSVKEQTNSGTKVLGEVVLPLLLTVENNHATKHALLLSFAPKNNINEYMPVTFITTVKNDGNVHIRPRGNIFIRNIGEKDIAILDVNEGIGAILPHSNRSFITDWTDGFFVMQPQDTGNNQPTHMHLAINWDKVTHFRFGKYTAQLLLVYDNGTKDMTLEGSTTFWIIPYTLLGITAGTIIVLIFLIRLLVKLYVKHELKKYQMKNQG